MPNLDSPYWKFRTVDANSLKMLINKQIWFSDPLKFNDPFDTQISLKDYLSEIKDIVEINHNDDIRLLAEAYLSKHEEYLGTRLLYCVNRRKEGFNPFEEVLMWSHYANEHKGICIGLTMDSVKQQLPKAGSFSIEKDVTYGAEEFAKAIAADVNNWPSYGPLRDEFNQKEHAQSHDIRTKGLLISRIYDAFSFVKSKNWEYEHEYRFAFDNVSAGKSVGKLVSFNPTDLESIIFGLNTIESDKATVRNLLTAPEWKHVEIWQAKRGTGIFKLDFDRLK
jgi:hypothetical protein